MPKFKTDYHITLNETNIVKAIAICAMLWHHLFLEHREYGPGIFRFALIAKVCVALFVFLSGYGMATKYQKGEKNLALRHKSLETAKFLAQRFTKFYLSYWFIFAITVPLGVFVFGRPLSAAYGNGSCLWANMFIDLFGFQSLNSYNITWWFNRLILVLWLLFPLFYWSMKSRFVYLWMLILFYLNPGHYLDFFNVLAPGFTTYAVVYMLGICLAINIDRINLMLNHVSLHIVATVSIVSMIAFLYIRNICVFPFFSGIKVDPFLVIFISLSIVCICRLTKHNLTPLAFVGRHSMNMYLLHTFIFSYFFSDFIYGFKHPALIFGVLFLISLSLSVVLEYLKGVIGFHRIQNIVTRKLDFVHDS